MLIKNWYQKIENRVLLERHVSVLRTDGVFDEEYYLANNLDVAEQGIDPVRHFLQNGCDEGRKPCASFSPRAYMALNHDVACSGVNPLVHYALFGQDEKRLIPALDTAELFVSDSSEQTILFISHNAHRGGAQKLLLDYLRWLQQNTRYNLKLICLDGGFFIDRFQQVADVLIYNDVTALYRDGEQIRDIVRSFAGGQIALIYGNSLASGIIYDVLRSIYDVPVITHAHELDKTINGILDRKAVDNAVALSTHFVACSNAVAHALQRECGIDPRKISLVYEYIPAAFNPLPDWDRKGLREALGVSPEHQLVVGCGNVHWRKGPDLFIQVAERVIEALGESVQFVWIGDFRSGVAPKFGDWNRLVESGLNEQISFIGGHENPRLILAAADVFLLPSREDPFPVACLEAAACGVPIVCFEGAGGMPEFVEDTHGRVVPYEDVDTMATACASLLSDDRLRAEMGQAAYRAIVSDYTDAQAGPKLLHLCQQVGSLAPEVTVILPVAGTVESRSCIDSILNQTYQNIEVLLCGDALDRNEDLAALCENTRNVRVVSSLDEALGNVSGNIVWLANSNGIYRDDFLEGVLPDFANSAVRFATGNPARVRNAAIADGEMNANGLLCRSELISETSPADEDAQDTVQFEDALEAYRRQVNTPRP